MDESRRRRHADYMRKYWAKRRAAGVCVSCGTPAAKSLCSRCFERKAAWKREQNKQLTQTRGDRRSAGLCTECGGGRTAGYVTCAACREKRTTVAFRQRAAAQQRKRNTGVTSQQYAALLKSQDSRCAICGVAAPDAPKGTLCADHDHNTGQPRGLLCIRCNSGLGLLKDDERVLEAALDYLRRHRTLRAV